MRLVLLVLLAVVLVYGAAFVRLALRLRRGAPAPRPLARAVDRALFGAATLGTALLAYGLWGEPRRLEVTTVALPLAELAPGSTPIRLVQISDLHSPSNVALHETLATRVRALRPHAIVFTGDAVNTPAGAVEARALFTRLGAIAPTYAVRGNRDAVLKGAPLFEGTGAIELDGATAGLADGRNRLVVVGATWVYVNRGIGMEALLPKVRILARPEVTLLELRPAGPPG